ncbi:MAG: hypothetical protein KME40_25320 [Komarekiella atlantica HA4396-MV6]|nr:hypothetical protein [Komarekiella atlantica HA4396-MV6]
MTVIQVLLQVLCHVRYDRRSHFTPILSYWAMTTSDRTTAFTIGYLIVKHLKLQIYKIFPKSNRSLTDRYSILCRNKNILV